MFIPLPVLVCFAVFRCETTEFQNQMKLTEGLLQDLWQYSNLMTKLAFMMRIKGQTFPIESASSIGELTVDSGSWCLLTLCLKISFAQH